MYVVFLFWFLLDRLDCLDEVFDVFGSSKFSGFFIFIFFSVSELLNLKYLLEMKVNFGDF